MTITIPVSVIGWGVVGATTLVALSFLLSFVGAIFGDFLGFGGLGAYGQTFAWSDVAKSTWTIGKVAAPIGFVLGVLIAMGLIVTLTVIALYFGIAFLLPMLIMDRLRLHERIAVLSQGDSLSRKSAYIRMMYVVGPMGVVLLIGTILIVAVLHVIWLAVVTFWLALAMASVFVWTHSRCPF